MALSPGARLGPYEVVSALGAGGMGEVYKARDTRLDRTVAIKVLPESLAGDPQFRERFDREARVISQLTHPHICTLTDRVWRRPPVSNGGIATALTQGRPSGRRCIVRRGCPRRCPSRPMELRLPRARHTRCSTCKCPNNFLPIRRITLSRWMASGSSSTPSSISRPVLR